MGLKEDIRIDLNNLHLEWQRMPELAEKYHEELAEAIEETDIAEQKRDLCESELFIDIQQHFKEFKFDKKPTDSIAKAKAKTQKEYQLLATEAIKCKRRVNSARAAIKAISYKKTGLGDEVSLWLGKYYSEPTANKTLDRKEVKDIIQEKTESSRRGKVRGKLKRSKKKSKE